MSSHNVKTELENLNSVTADATAIDLSNFSPTIEDLTCDRVVCGSVTSSGAIAGTTLAASSTFKLSDVDTVAAAGTGQSDATEITGVVNLCTGANGAAGVKLVAATAGNAGTFYYIYNSSSNNLFVYPGTSDIINGGVANQPILLGAYEFCEFVVVSSTTWGVVRPGANSARVRVFEDFLADAGATLPIPWGTQDTSSAGSPTLAYVADALNGTFTLTHDTQSEQQNLTLYWADQLMIDPTKNPIFECRMKINFAGATFTADQRIVIGLAAARNATLDSNTQHVWFRIEGANLNILKEADDGTTDTDDVDTTIDIVDDTYTTFRIDLSNTSDIKMYVDGVAVGGATLAAAALSASHKLQPYIEIQRDAGAEAEAVTIDYIMVEQDRY